MNLQESIEFLEGLECCFLCIFGILEEEFQVIELKISKVSETEVNVMISDTALPLFTGTHQLYVELFVPLRRKYETFSHKKGKNVIELTRISLGGDLDLGS